MVKRGWMMRKVHGSTYMKGWPDYWCYHPDFGMRWVEMKRPNHGRLKNTQIKFFGELNKFGCPVTIALGVEDYLMIVKKENNWWKWAPGLSKEWRHG
jgi:hypothetical protein